MVDPTNPAASAAAGTATPSADAGTGAADANADRNNHEARLRAGGDWAVEYAKKLESRADKAERDARELATKTSALDRYFKAGLSGNDIAGHLGTLEKTLQDPQAGPAFRNYLATGKLEMPKGSRAADDDDEYLSDEQRELRALRAEVAEVRGYAQESLSGLGQQVVAKNLSTIADELGLSAEDRAIVQAKGVEIVQGWGREGESGRRAIKSLQHAEHGLKAARTLVLEALGPEGQERVYRQKFLREQQTRRGMATDSPSPGRGQASALPEVNSIAEAFQILDARPELLDEHGY